MDVMLKLNSETTEILENLARCNALDVSQVVLGLMQVGIDTLGVGWEATFLYNSEREDIARTIFEDTVRHKAFSDQPAVGEEAHSIRENVESAWADAVRGNERLVWKN